MIADFFRFLWGLVYWNVRKSVYRRRPDRYRCPCQAPSDSGRAMETGCEASLLWSKPARFSRVCPLLVQTPKGLRCSVNAADVRPFWGRAAGVYFGGIGGLYLLAVFGAFLALRGIGFPVALDSVAWPPRWPRINSARAQYYLARGTEALKVNNTREALANFGTAFELAPLDYDIGYANAALWQLTAPGKSDATYNLLMLNHPEKRDQTADAWHRALLARGDFVQVRELARRELVRGDEHGNYWMNSLLFATRQLGDTEPLQQLLTEGSGLAPHWRKLLQTELLVRGTTAQRASAVAVLREPWIPEAANLFVAHYQVDRLNTLKQPYLAISLGEGYHQRLGDDEFYRLQLDSWAIAQESATLNARINQLLASPNLAPVVEIVATHLAKYPNPAALRATLAELRTARLPPGPAAYNALISLYSAAGVAGDSAALGEIGVLLKSSRGAGLPSLDAAREFFLEKPQRRSIGFILSSMRLPLELTYVLLERFPLGTGAVAPK